MNQGIKLLLLLSACLFALNLQVKADTLADSACALDAERALDAGDYVKATQLLRPLAEQGLDQAQLNLGLLYAQGNGVPQDYPEAAKWYRLAAEQGYAKAQLNLAAMYGNGQGVSKYFVMAYVWAHIAAGNETDVEARKLSGDIQAYVAKRMNAVQMAEAREFARKCIVNKFKGC